MINFRGFEILLVTCLLLGNLACEAEQDEQIPSDTDNGDQSTTPQDEQIPILWDEPVEADSDLEYCLKMSRASGTACTTCVCTECYDEVIACYFDEGCTYLRECSFATGCQGFECMTECSEVFAKYGARNSPSWDLVDALQLCGNQNCDACAGDEEEVENPSESR